MSCTLNASTWWMRTCISHSATLNMIKCISRLHTSSAVMKVSWKWIGSVMSHSQLVDFNLEAFILSFNPLWYLASCVLYYFSVMFFNSFQVDGSSEIQFTSLLLLFYFFCSHLILLTSQVMMKDFFII